MTLETHVDRILASWSRLGSAGEFCCQFEAITIMRFTPNLFSCDTDETSYSADSLIEQLLLSYNLMLN
jgi:hypothetical protein